MKEYTKENFDKAIRSMDKLIELDNLKTKKIYQLKYTLIRMNRALDKEFWFDKLDRDARIKAIKMEKELMLNTNGRLPQLMEGLIFVGKTSDAYFYLLNQWKKDKEQLEKEMKEKGITDKTKLKEFITEKNKAVKIN
jgi:hypothetical protein